ncbi:hypothetical protein [Pararhodobacter marinus]|uniref:hypothetical protein n=1 Tax=Pararhodobacter marinus TaxID=2184063 RepID=UPI003511DEDF
MSTHDQALPFWSSKVPDPVPLPRCVNLNDAFSSVVQRVAAATGVDMDKNNVTGGGIGPALVIERV